MGLYTDTVQAKVFISYVELVKLSAKFPDLIWASDFPSSASSSTSSATSLSFLSWYIYMT